MTPLLADDVDDVKAAVLEFYEQLNSENPDFSSFYLPGGDSFPRTGSLLQPNNLNRAAVRANFDNGLDFNVEVRHLEVKVHGNAAVATYYTTGSTKYADGTILSGIFRASITAVKQGRQWKWAHIHISEVESD